MPKRTRIYTRTGDGGLTGLIGGGRVKKSAPQIDTYGTVDELSSAIGLARAALRPFLADGGRVVRLDAWLAWTQDVLFNLGSALATPRGERIAGIPRVGSDDVEALERAIDEADADLAPLANFIHPGGSLPAAHLHLARAICRRAERLAVALRDLDENESLETVRYLNRLSDALFVWARWINDALGMSEHIWDHASHPPTA